MQNKKPNSVSIKLLNSEQVANSLGVSRSFAYALMRRGEIQTVRFGRAVRVRPEDLEQFIHDNLGRGLNA